VPLRVVGTKFLRKKPYPSMLTLQSAPSVDNSAKVTDIDWLLSRRRNGLSSGANPFPPSRPDRNFPQHLPGEASSALKSR